MEEFFEWAFHYQTPVWVGVVVGLFVVTAVFLWITMLVVLGSVWGWVGTYIILGIAVLWRYQKG